MTVTLFDGDCREVLRGIPDSSIDSGVMDPPYALVSIVKRFANSPRSENTENTENPYGRTGRGFMGQRWDTGDTAHDPAFWAEVLRVLKPGAHLVAFGGTRTYHRMVCAIEDAGFEIRDQIAWLYGTGFPKSHDVSKGIDRAAGAERHVLAVDGSRLRPNRDKYLLAGQPGGGGKLKADNGATVTAPATDAARQWDGWGTALKPALEPICLARKPLIGTVAANVLEHGTGALNVGGCRIEHAGAEVLGASLAKNPGRSDKVTSGIYGADRPQQVVNRNGRWPANVIHDGSEEVLAAFPEGASGAMKHSVGGYDGEGVTGFIRGRSGPDNQHGDSGSSARFFFSAKADAEDRWGSRHPTVKPVELIRWLMRLVTPPGGTVLDCFAGSGTAGIAALAEGFGAILIEREEQYLADIRERLAFYAGEGRHSLASRNRNARPAEAGPLLAAMGIE